ncbi:MAG: hypothetical protein M0008_06360 [Actinomycetota bacterium]|nr:hypothetical protein [Actinomycetota bacterium]
MLSLHTFDRTLAENSTPDWLLYCVAASAGFDALVTRDRSQLDQLVEMYVLSRLSSFTIITWKKPIEDPVREWGQLLAYLPEVKKHLQPRSGVSIRPEVILLPAPTITDQNLVRAADGVGTYARKHGVSHRQANDNALDEIRAGLNMMARDPYEFDELLRLGSPS